MPRTRKDEAPLILDEPVIEARYVELDEYTVGFERYPVDLDPAPYYKGLPDDRCQCPHWGVVVSGTITMRYAGREETYTSGDVYYAPPGHLPIVYAGGEVIEFSPTAELAKTSAVIGANMAAMAATS